MITDSTPSSEVAVKVQVPQIHGFKLTYKVTEIGSGTGGEGSFGVVLENTGNGDDMFTIELSNPLPAGWEISPKLYSVNITKGDIRPQAFIAHSPDEFESGSITIGVTVSSNDSLTTETFDVIISKASIKLYIDQDAIATLSDTVADKDGKLVIPLTNLGFLESSDVSVSAKIIGREETLVRLTNVVTLSPNSTTNVEFEVLAADATGNVRFEVTVMVIGDDSSHVVQEIGLEGEQTIDFSIQYFIDVDSEESPWFTVIIALVGGLVIYGGVRVSRAKSTSSRF